MNKTQQKWLLVKAAIVTLFISIIVLAEISTYTIAITIIFILCIMILFTKKMKSAYVRDERTKKLGAFAAAYSWMLTLIVISLIFWIDHLNLYILTVKETVLITGAVMIFSQIFVQLFFMRKGDV